MPNFVAFCRDLGANLGNQGPTQRVEVLERGRNQIRDEGEAGAWEQLVSRFARSVVLDMAAQGWAIDATGEVRLTSPQLDLSKPEKVKEQIRQWHLLERDAQLQEKSVIEFVRRMEQPSLYKGAWHSITSVMRDGSELAKAIGPILQMQSEQEREAALAEIIQPYLQLVEPDVVCAYTGLKLADIWRYFRHTWVNPYKSLPGRSMMVLIRDAAGQNHPVIGIGALGSSMAQQTQRDQWIGWDSDIFYQKFLENPSRKFQLWLRHSLRRLIKAVYVEDFFRSRILTPERLQAPDEIVIERLLRVSRKASEQHRRFPHAASHKSSTNKNAKVVWEKQARTHLFRSKRAKTLAILLSIKRTLQTHGLLGRARLTRAQVKQALARPDVRTAVRQVVRMVKAENVGVKMMDIIVCGAVAPYGALLGGKLVCSLLCSPEVVDFYQRKYAEQQSIIASSVRGKAVVRPPQLVLLATTSLYGVGSSQYNRIKIPVDQCGGHAGQVLEYRNLGVSKGFGSYHFSQLSLSLMESLLARSRDGKRVNSIFGEGVNPLMRKIRDGLVLAGLPSDDLLKHGNVRVVYGIALAENFREILLGLESRPRYLIPRSKPRERTGELAAFWRRRWLVRRIASPGILDEVAKHTLAFPLTHGARVPVRQDQQGELFEASRGSLNQTI